MGFRDNRSIRDRSYKGDLIISCDDGSLFCQSEGEALESIKNIINIDLDYLNEHHNKLVIYEEGIKSTDEKLIFTNFCDNNFFKIVRDKINEGYEFNHPEASNGNLTVEEFDNIVFKYMNLIHHNFNRNEIHFGLHKKFYLMYEEHKENIGWFWADNPVKGWKYMFMSSKNILSIITTCNERITEINNRLKKLEEK